MVAPFLATEEGRNAMKSMVPKPLHPGKWGHPDEVAKLLAFLVSEDNSLTTGQVVFIDGGYDAVMRSGDIWEGQVDSNILAKLSQFADK
eukprot:m.148117 g.148117  ORF g.148117 m.148117 type:complete len:89 (+) comp23190_c1_seq4:1115-1381(+)